MHVLTLLIIVIVVSLPGSVFGGEALYIESEINSLKVLETLYGKVTIKNGVPDEPAIWRNIDIPADLGDYWQAKEGEVYAAFEAKYREDGTDKYVLVTQTRPYGDETYLCHACAPLVGCAVFVKSDNRWVIESHNKYIGVIGKWGWINRRTADRSRMDVVELVDVGRERYGIVIRGSDVHQGYENYYIYLIVPYRDRVGVSLTVGTEGAGEGACRDAGAKNKQGVGLQFDKSAKSAYHDLVITKSWNKGSCGKVKSVKESKVYKFVNGTYVEKKKSVQSTRQNY